ncbi:hypothetical protein BC834DRAFT_269760 [Gloeopeniophorella convolvens]|nr:hypothetical protein BC834DRAFT_269760 [Gloeopeniophorella convolvens]
MFQACSLNIPITYPNRRDRCLHRRNGRIPARQHRLRSNGVAEPRLAPRLRLVRQNHPRARLRQRRHYVPRNVASGPQRGAGRHKSALLGQSDERRRAIECGYRREPSKKKADLTLKLQFLDTTRAANAVTINNSIGCSGSCPRSPRTTRNVDKGHSVHTPCRDPLLKSDVRINARAVSFRVDFTTRAVGPEFRLCAFAHWEALGLHREPRIFIPDRSIRLVIYSRVRGAYSTPLHSNIS